MEAMTTPTPSNKLQTPGAAQPAWQPNEHPIKIRGARQNNLKNLDIDIRTGELLVVTGVSGSGKSSLVFDTLYAEGQRRYVETFSAYARQFLDRMDKPQVDRIEGVPPAIAIDQSNQVRTSRSTVGTMTELNDHVKLLFARAAGLHCRQCAAPVKKETVESIQRQIKQMPPDARMQICFSVRLPSDTQFNEDQIRAFLSAQGYVRVIEPFTPPLLHVVQDRFRLASVEESRLAEAVEVALDKGKGQIAVFLDDETTPHRFSSTLSCANCAIDYTEPLPSSFSFNSPLGACDTCRGFGRVIGFDLGLVLPDANKSLRAGAVKPWQTESFKECQVELLGYGAKEGIDLDTPWKALSQAQQSWVIDGGADWTGDWKRQWYGIRRFFDWLESKAYKMHIRVLLSRYRSYTPCTTCEGSRLKPDSLLWRVGNVEEAEIALGSTGKYKRFKPAGAAWNDAQMQRLAGLSIHDVMLLPIDKLAQFFGAIKLEGSMDEATDLLLTEVRSRLKFLCDVGLGYLTLDRQSRTLSGGEVQRINLTTALGTSLVNTLFVLDEPSIGLHPRDMDKVIGVMHRLRDAGNTLVVVEHDPAVMFAADRIMDIGPGAGEKGGHIVYYDVAQKLAQAHTLTADYLTGRLSVSVKASEQKPLVNPKTPKLIIEGASEHNLQNVDVSIPLGALVCITGVSGSGKSTLMQNVLLPALLKAKGKPTESPGAYSRLMGDDWLDDVTFVDQSAIGKTTRSNPASYVGAFDVIRKRFAATTTALERGYTPGTFSFNSGDGRCPTCSGNGFEHVEMQFLSDVYLRCPDCDGRRFRSEVLEAKVIQGQRHLSVADVLDLTVSEAIALFTDDFELKRYLQPIADVGLEYVKLGQPVPTLSGGEAQRLKLAGFLAEAANKAAKKKQEKQAFGGTLFLFDEPTTGLHFDDIAKLLRSFRKLQAAGHSLIVIEHNLDLISAADWIIDLGPEGGDAGGLIVAQGTPQHVRDTHDQTSSATGKALALYDTQLKSWSLKGANAFTVAEKTAGYGDSGVSSEDEGLSLQAALRRTKNAGIRVHNAREHNLKNIDVEIPREQMTVITGVSGSGKSTLAFDVIFGEGQRRYLESLNAYARQFVQPASKPDVDGVFGIPPTVAIEQRTSRGGRKSTVATLTEIYHFLRLLYVKLGTQHCPKCNLAVDEQSFDVIVARIMRDFRGQHIGLLAPLVVGRKGVYTDLAKWANGKGYSHLRIDKEFIPTKPFPRIDRYIEHNIELPVADLLVSPANELALREALQQALDLGKGLVMVMGELDKLKADRGVAAQLPTTLFSTKRACASCGTSFAELDPRLFSFNSKMGWCTGCIGTGVKFVPKESSKEGLQSLTAEPTDDELDASMHCTSCDGNRLNPTALAVRLKGQSIAQMTSLPVVQATSWLQGLELSGRQAQIGRDILTEIAGRLKFLDDVGLGYISLDRSAPTLSGGEAQRIRLAGQLGSTLQGVCYVLDEPTIGLHPRDNRILLDTLDKLKARGNTLIVVEHDEDTIARADHIIDIGPGAGRLGGYIIASGTIDDIKSNPKSITGQMLSKPLQHASTPKRPIAKDHPMIHMQGITLHNVHKQSIAIPLERLTVLTGVSGSGKSTIARDVLLSNLQGLVSAKNNRKPVPPLLGLAALEGWESFTKVLEVDQTPIGKTPRSCAATYIGFWDPIRRLFAESNEAKLRGYAANRFSFNTGNGRCPTCEGQGMQTIEMNFLPDVKVLCESCRGARFNKETLAITMRGKSVGDILAMSVDEAVDYFASHKSILHPLKLLQDVGLGYLTLGQPSPTLSGGEAQRIKLVSELATLRELPEMPREVANAAEKKTPPRKASGLYILDEPTVGLHMADVEKLIRVLHRLVDAGNTVVVVEHNLDIWATADWILDMGPEGGSGGGQVVAQGSPQQLVKRGKTHTERLLAEFVHSR
jgi:excinuclease ABC subunit A